MNDTIPETLTQVCQNLYKSKPHELANHAIVFGTNVQGEVLMPFTLLLNSFTDTYSLQMQGFGVMLKSMGIHAEIVALVINGMMPDFKLRPVSIVLVVGRNGDCMQNVVDFRNDAILPSFNISDEDKAICSALFLGQVNYKPELRESRWN